MFTARSIHALLVAMAGVLALRWRPKRPERASVRVRDGHGGPTCYQLLVLIHLPLQAPRPIVSTNLAESSPAQRGLRHPDA